MKKIVSLVSLFCVGFIANAMLPELPKDNKKNFEVIQKTEKERFIAKKIKDKNKERSLKRSQERDRKYHDQDEGQ